MMNGHTYIKFKLQFSWIWRFDFIVNTVVLYSDCNL